MGSLALLLLGILGIMLYFLPTMIGWNKHNVLLIFFVNLLFGWSVLGWVIALIWALAKDGTTTVVINNDSMSYPGSSYNSTPAKGSFLSITDELNKLDQLRQRGVINEAQFETQKKRLLGV